VIPNSNVRGWDKKNRRNIRQSKALFQVEFDLIRSEILSHDVYVFMVKVKHMGTSKTVVIKLYLRMIFLLS
jgi:hypothetical protein